MAEPRFLIVRLSSLGDIVLSASAAAMLRGSFPGAQVDWLVDRRWADILIPCGDFHEIIRLDRGSWKSLAVTVRKLRAARYTCAIDFQGLYKSALLAYLSGAPRRIGFARPFLRESGAAFFYTDQISPPPGHIADQNRALARAAGASPRIFGIGFPKWIEEPQPFARRMLSCDVGAFFVVNPGGGWGSKCWPAERYGQLCRELGAQRDLRPVVNYGPGEEPLAEAVARAAAPANVILFRGEIQELKSLLAGAKFVVAGDTGPLHLAVALGTPVVGLYGPTDPVRNGPYGKDDVVVCNERFEGMEHERGHSPAASMLSITVEQVLDAVHRRLEKLQ